MKICPQCTNEFLPSSRHLKCPTCRSKPYNVQYACPDCGKGIAKEATTCKNCQLTRTPILAPENCTTSLKEFLRRAKNRKKLGDLTLADLEAIWDSQQGVCPYSGVQLLLPSYKQKNNAIYVASLDRIDSALPYTHGNVQFVSAAVNHMKGVLSHEDTVKLCKLIAQNWN